MTHPDDARLNDYVDGRLDPTSGADIESHLVECDDCRGRVEAIRDLVARLEALPAGIRPRRDLRPPRPEAASPTISSRLVDALWHGPWLRAAVVAAAMVGAGIGIWLGAGPDGSAPAGIRSPVAASYARAGDDLVALLDARRGELSPAAARALEASLTTVEAAIRELEHADVTGDEAVELERQLEARQRTRLDLLRGALDLLEGS